jgi:hydroxyacylglutathione hydrolase
MERLTVYLIPVLRDNYIFLLVDHQERKAVVIDPAQAQPVIEQVESLGVELTAIWNTHHCWDHVGGNQALKERYPQLKIYASQVDGERKRIPGQTTPLKQGDTFSFAGEEIRVLFVPGHTLGHIAYWLPQSGHLFAGDTLFGAGCGRLHEGTPAQMQASLHQLRALPDETLVWCAHEYTLNNLHFALTVDPHNPDLKERLQSVEALRAQGKPTVPLRLAEEKRTNPFLRYDQPALQRSTGEFDPVNVFAKVRSLKDRW